jgi:hypothetical protein
MPTIFEYFGILLKFFSNEHYPIHVHAIYGDKYQMKVKFEIKNDKIVSKKYEVIKGFKEFPPSQLRDLKKLIDKYDKQIVEAWIDFSIKNKKVERKLITTKIK